MSIDMVDHSIVLFLEWNVLASLFTYAIKCSEIVFSIRCVTFLFYKQLNVWHCPKIV